MKKLLIIGAGFLQNFIIKKVSEMGYVTYVVDANPNSVGFKNANHFEVIDITNKEKCLDYAMKHKVDGVLTVSTDYGVLTASYIAKCMNLPGLDYKVAKIIKNKFEVRKILSDNNIDDMDKAYLVDDTTDFSSIIGKIKLPVMVKPCDGSGSRGASKVSSISNLETACREAIESSITGRAEIETFIDGREYGVESIVDNGEIYVLGIMEKLMTKPPLYSELGHCIPSNLDYEIEKKISNYVKNAIRVLGINTGSVNMDIIINEENKIYIIDIGARMGGNMIGPSLIPLGTGIDYMAAVIKNALGESIDLTPLNKMSVASRLLAFDGGSIKKLPDIKRFEKRYDVQVYHKLKEGIEVKPYQTNVDGYGYIIAEDITREKALAKVNLALENLRDIIFNG